MKFTGEFYVPEQHGNIEFEHLHRYLQATEIAEGKSVVDIACGEGYGSLLLAGKAASVTGIDISEDLVKHARLRYRRDNLTFSVGSCADIPLPDRSVDIVVSFETIEHHDDHDSMMREIKRILRPAGCLLISTPDKLRYSIEPGTTNPFHVKELFEDEFKALIRLHFRNAIFFGQRLAYGSTIFSDGATPPAMCYWRDPVSGEIASGNNRPLYRIALASDAKLPDIAVGLFEQPIDESEAFNSWREAVAQSAQAQAAIGAQVDDLTALLDKSRAQVTELKGIVNRSRAVARHGQGQLASLAKALAAHKLELDAARALAEQHGQQPAGHDKRLAVHEKEFGRGKAQEVQLAAPRSARLMRLREAVRYEPLIFRKIARVGRRSMALRLPRGRRESHSLAAYTARSNAQVPDFDPVFYLKSNPDVAAAGCDPLEHYREYGRAEGRLPRDPGVPLDTAQVPGFDPVFYLKSNPDVAAAGCDPLAHYLEYGRTEGRLPRDPHVPLDDEQLSQFAVPRESADYRPLVSIIVPAYNHAEFLDERLVSIYEQTYSGPVEILLLDDASTDRSLEVLNRYASRYPDRTTVLANEDNSGSAFRQWRRGLAWAKGEIVWIAESDDVCDLNFLATLVPLMANPAVMLAFARTLFFQGDRDNVVYTLEEHLHGLPRLRLDVPWIRSAKDLIAAGFYDRNLVPNASGAVLRHPGGLSFLDDEAWQAMQLAGDWMFYLELIKCGLVAFSPKTTDYHRASDTSLTTRVGKTARLAEEIAQVRSAAERIYGFAGEEMDVSAHESWWRRSPLPTISPAAAHRPPTLIVSYGLVAGGGETFPIFLANELRRRDWPVAFLDLAFEETEPAIRSLLAPNVPLYRLCGDAEFVALCRRLGIEVVHSCHSTTDLLVSRLLGYLTKTTRPKHVVTLHGGYEALTLEPLLLHLNQIQAVDQFVYTANKNLASFPKQFLDGSRFARIPNALPLTPTFGRDRSDLGIGESDVIVAMLISRAIPEKGWPVALEAVEDARVATGRDIHLVLIGNGPIYDEMRATPIPPWLHLLGVQADIRSWIATADVGLLPSTFSGESFPLVLIDFLTMGVPMITSAAGEIPQMMMSERGTAGFIVDETDPVRLRERVTEHITGFLSLDAQDRAAFRDRALAAAAKFNFEDMVDAYEQVYEILCSSSRPTGPKSLTTPLTRPTIGELPHIAQGEAGGHRWRPLSCGGWPSTRVPSEISGAE